MRPEFNYYILSDKGQMKALEGNTVRPKKNRKIN